MASSTVHLAITEELIRRRPFKNPDRLRFGSVLPDFRKEGNSHFFLYPCGGWKKTYDFVGFRERFATQMRQDDLHLGYYLHLLQDLGYRHFVYDRYNWNPRIEGNVDRLHNDYSLVNPHIVAKYHLADTMPVPEDFDREPLFEVAAFDLDTFQKNMHEFLTQKPEGEIFFFTREMSDAFIAESVESCLAELDRMERGEPLTSGYDNAWVRNPGSLLETTRNTRDLGTFRIEGTNRYTKTMRVLRSDMPKAPSANDIDFLKKKGITTIIDLRSEGEVSCMPHGLSGVEGFSYHICPIVEGSFVPESVEAVPGSYLAIAESKGTAEALRMIATSETGVMYSCSAGKDRSGVLSALILLLCGAEKSDIVFDYMVTKTANRERLMTFHESFPDIDINILIPHEEYMMAFIAMLYEKYGTIQNYYRSMGIGEDLQNALLAKMKGEK